MPLIDKLPGDDSLGSVREHLEAFRVVGACGHRDADALLLVQLELVVEDLLVECVLQALVGEIDQQLLELVLRVEVFESYAVQRDRSYTDIDKRTERLSAFEYPGSKQAT